MIRFFVRTFIASALVLPWAGCQKQQEPAMAPAAAVASTTPSTPEESFQLIVDTFRRGVEDVPIGFVVQDAGRQTMMTGRNEVSHELFPPANDGEPFKAVITVKSQSRYSLQRSTETGKSEEQDQAAEGENAGAAEDSGVQIFDPSIASSPDAGGTDRRQNTTPDKNAVMVARNDDEHERKYELVYENGRWNLVTKLDPKTEGSIKLAFERALDTQS